jgi:hypothetical protein
MTSFLFERRIRIFDYPKFGEPFRNRLRENAERLAAEAGLEIEFIRKRNFRKEDRVKEVLEKRGEHPGLVCIFSAMEPCSTYEPWHNKPTGKTYLVPDDGRCLHYYFYFVQADLQAIYENLARTAIHTVKPDNIATFLAASSAQFEGEMGNYFNIHIEGTRIKHTMGPVSLKLYDNFGLILRIETTVNDLTFSITTAR